MLKRWMEVLHVDEHDREVLEMVPQGETPGGSRFIILFNLQMQKPLPNGQMAVANKSVRHEIEARDVADAFSKYAKAMVNYGKELKQAEESKIVVPGPGTLNRLKRFAGGKNGGGLPPG